MAARAPRPAGASLRCRLALLGGATWQAAVAAGRHRCVSDIARQAGQGQALGGDHLAAVERAPPEGGVEPEEDWLGGVGG
eukprot:9492965-Lingulodinium_polyedra.AAC.1